MAVENYVKQIRLHEYTAVLEKAGGFVIGRNVLEIGSGDGTQLRLLRKAALSATGIDIIDGTMVRSQQEGVIYYDGVHIPFPDQTFDTIFTSHTLEHIADWRALNQEMRRVLKPHGCCVHVVPNAIWRGMSWLTHLPSQPRRYWIALRRWLGRCRSESSEAGTAFVPRKAHIRIIDTFWPSRHSEFGNRFSEIWHLRERAWRARLESNGWTLLSVSPISLTYTDNMIFNTRVPWAFRRVVGRVLPTSLLFVVKRIEEGVPYNEDF